MGKNSKSSKGKESKTMKGGAGGFSFENRIDKKKITDKTSQDYKEQVASFNSSVDFLELEISTLLVSAIDKYNEESFNFNDTNNATGNAYSRLFKREDAAATVTIQGIDDTGKVDTKVCITKAIEEAKSLLDEITGDKTALTKKIEEFIAKKPDEAADDSQQLAYNFLKAVYLAYNIKYNLAKSYYTLMTQESK